MFKSSTLRHFPGRLIGRRSVGRPQARRRLRLALEGLETRLALLTLTINVNDNSDTPTYPSTVTYSELGVDLFDDVTLRDTPQCRQKQRQRQCLRHQPADQHDLQPDEHRQQHVRRNGLPLISSTTTIVGNGSTIERTGSNAFRLFDVASDGSLTLLDMTLTGGLAAGTGRRGGWRCDL